MLVVAPGRAEPALKSLIVERKEPSLTAYPKYQQRVKEK
jgi:hypothetical protein